MGAKIWAVGSGEPSSYTIEYSGALTTSGSYLLLGYQNASATWYSNVYFDDLTASITK